MLCLKSSLACVGIKRLLLHLAYGTKKKLGPVFDTWPTILPHIVPTHDVQCCLRAINVQQQGVSVATVAFE